VTEVVLDSNVLVPSVLRDTVLTLAEHELLEPRWTHAILAEVRRVVIDRLGVRPATIDRTLAIMTGAFPEAVIVDWERHVDAIDLPDPDDRHVAAAAVAAEVPTILTANVRHFPVASLQPHGITARPPDALLGDLATSAPRAVRSALVAQAARYRRPPMDLTALLAALAPAGAPSLAQHLR
jgi:hypothetical protein